MGKHDTRHLIAALDRLDENLDVQWGRVGLMERWLENHTRRLDDLSSRIDQSLARIDALLSSRKVTT
jgi:hypothetical protein